MVKEMPKDESFFKELYKENEIKFSIISILDWYGSLSLRKISRLMGRKEPITHKHLKELVEKKWIILDESMTATEWGKFYKLSPEVNSILERTTGEIGKHIENAIKETDNFEKMYKTTNEFEIRKKKLLEYAELLKTRSVGEAMKRHNFLSTNIQNAIINSIIWREKEILKAVENDTVNEFLEQHKSLGTAGVSIFNIKIDRKKIEHKIKLNRILINFIKELYEFEIEMKEELKEKKIADDDINTHYVSMFSGFTDF